MSKRRFAKEQPRVGDVSLHCGHESVETNYFKAIPHVTFTSPAGHEGKAQWLVACDACYEAAGRDVKKLPMRKVLVKMDDTPLIWEDS